MTERTDQKTAEAVGPLSFKVSPYLLSFRQEYRDVPLHVISLAENPYRLDEVLVMPWKLYVENIGKYLL